MWRREAKARQLPERPTVFNGRGEQLDEIGRTLQIPRGACTDDEYRRPLISECYHRASSPDMAMMHVYEAADACGASSRQLNYEETRDEIKRLVQKWDKEREDDIVEPAYAYDDWPEYDYGYPPPAPEPDEQYSDEQHYESAEEADAADAEYEDRRLPACSRCKEPYMNCGCEEFCADLRHTRD